MMWWDVFCVVVSRSDAMCSNMKYPTVYGALIFQCVMVGVMLTIRPDLKVNIHSRTEFLHFWGGNFCDQKIVNL